MPIPKPIIHDEFSYLLGADTYAHGRLANPAHPFWQHFETFQVMQQPVYASKYQPLQALVLAFGEKLFAEPWIGVWLSTGLLCAAICWMLQGWMSSMRWALAGAVLFALRVGVFSYWMNSYEGGTVPGIGGALAFGALPRMGPRGQTRHLFTWAIGLGILALSRPYDAAMVGIASGAILLWWLRRPVVRFRAWVPALMIFAAVGGFVLYNNDRVTGSAFTLPYAAHDRQYVVASMFSVLPLSPEPVYRHAVMREFYADWNVGLWRDARSEPIPQTLAKLAIFHDFFFGFWPLAIPLLLWPFALETTEARLTVLLLGVFLLMILPLIAVVPHYGASFAGVLYLRFAQNWSRLSEWRPGGRAVGRWLAVALGGLYLVAFCNSAAGLVRHGESPALLSGQDSMSRRFGERDVEFGFVRDSMERRLAARAEKQVVLVRYALGHNRQNEWVYNSADIDASRVVWAREMGPEQDAPLLQYFHDRRAWLLEADQSPPKLTLYREAK